MKKLKTELAYINSWDHISDESEDKPKKATENHKSLHLASLMNTIRQIDEWGGGCGGGGGESSC